MPKRDASSLTAALIRYYFPAAASYISPVIHGERENLLIFLLFQALASLDRKCKITDVM